MSGLIGRKIGMTSIFDENGKNIPCTVIEAGPCVVTQVRTKEVDGYDALQLGFDDAKKTNKAAEGHAYCRWTPALIAKKPARRQASQSNTRASSPCNTRSPRSVAARLVSSTNCANGARSCRRVPSPMSDLSWR